VGLRQSDSLAAIRRFARNLKAVTLENGFDALTDDLVIVGDENLQRCGSYSSSMKILR